MSTLYSFARVVSDEDGVLRTAIAVIPKMPIEGMILDTVGSDETYRPDKIADRLFGDPSLSWVIDEANNWYNGLSEYRIGRQFYYPDESTLRLMGIL